MTPSSTERFTLTMDELRAVVSFAAGCAERVLPEFEVEAPDDKRPRDALRAATVFADGAPRTNELRTSAFAAHRASKTMTVEAAQLAALACGDAAAAAYLHPIARATQVGHILRAAACAARVAELRADAEKPGGAGSVETLARQAVSPVPDVLRRYPPAPSGNSHLARLMGMLDATIRARD